MAKLIQLTHVRSDDLLEVMLMINTDWIEQVSWLEGVTEFGWDEKVVLSNKIKDLRKAGVQGVVFMYNPGPDLGNWFYVKESPITIKGLVND